MKPTTARRFGSLGRSFVAPAAAAAVMGAALIASDTTDTAQTVWSPAAACLLPDVLPVAGTLLSYGGSRQLAAGGTVTHAGTFQIGSTDRLQLLSNSSVPRIVAATSNIDRGEIGFTLTSAYIYHTSGQVTTRGTRLAVRSIDNTADAPITCAGITASGKIAVSPGAFSATGIQVDADSGIYNTSGNGRVRVRANGVDVAGFRSDGLYLSMVEFNAIDGVRATCLSQASAGVLQVGTTANNAAGSLMLTNLNASAFVDSAGFRASGGNGLLLATSGSFSAGVRLQNLGVDGKVRISNFASNGGVYLDTQTADTLTIRNLADSSGGAIICGAITASGSIRVSNDVADTLSVRSDVRMLEFLGNGATTNGVGIGGSGFRPGINLAATTAIYFTNDIPASPSEGSLRRGGTGIVDIRANNGFRVRNLDNSADAVLTCGAITTSGSMTSFDGFRISGGTVNRSITFGGTIQDYSHSDNAATSRRFRWLANNVTELANLWTDSGQAKLFEIICPSASRIGRITQAASGQTANLDEWRSSVGGVMAFVSSTGALQETPTQSVLNPTTTNIPSGRRQGWYNSALAEFRDWVNIGGTLLKSAAYT